MNILLPQWKSVARPVIGMIHLLPLRGAPQFSGDGKTVFADAVRDAEALVEGGVNGLMLENFGDVPFYPGRVPASVVAQVTAVAYAVKTRFPQVPLGINVLRNDGLSALGIAAAIGAEFIRVNVLSGARVADQGLLQGIAHDLLRERTILGATNIRIFADIDVKHSAPLASRPMVDEVDDTIHRGLADALIVSGAGTGKPTDPKHVATVAAAAGEVPVFLGSGVSIKNIASFLPQAGGFIVGTAFKKDGAVELPVDVARVKALMAAVG